MDNRTSCIPWGVWNRAADVLRKFIPIPSELIMPLGFTVGQGKMQFAPVVVAGVVGTVLERCRGTTHEQTLG